MGSVSGGNQTLDDKGTFERMPRNTSIWLDGFYRELGPCPFAAPLIQAKETGFISRTDVAFLYPKNKDNKLPAETRTFWTWAAATTSDWGPKKMAFSPSSSINKHLFRSYYLFGFMFQSWVSLSRLLPNTRISPGEAALGCQQVGLQEVSPVWRTQCLEGLAPKSSLG